MQNSPASEVTISGESQSRKEEGALYPAAPCRVIFVMKAVNILKKLALNA